MLTLGMAYWATAILVALFLFVCVLMILAVLIQRPAGGGLSGAFGSGAGSGQTAFGAKTGDALTFATIGIFFFYLLFAVGLNYATRPAKITAGTTVPVNGTVPGTGSSGAGAPGATDSTGSPVAESSTGATGATGATSAPGTGAPAGTGTPAATTPAGPPVPAPSTPPSAPTGAPAPTGSPATPPAAGTGGGF